MEAMVTEEVVEKMERKVPVVADGKGVSMMERLLQSSQKSKRRQVS